MTSHTSTHPHILPLRVYLLVAATLLVLTAITVTVSEYNLGPVNLLVAISIAAIKATLVALFFMHLLYDNKMYLAIFIVAVMFLAMFIIFTMFDTQFRGNVNPDVAHPINPNAEIYKSSPDSSANANAVSPADSSASAPAPK